MEIGNELNQGTYNDTLRGKFTFSDHIEFREVLHKIEDNDVTQIVFHLGNLEFVDSTGLGMLLLALDAAESQQKKLTITGAMGQVKKMFDLARFHTLFSMA